MHRRQYVITVLGSAVLAGPGVAHAGRDRSGEERPDSNTGDRRQTEPTTPTPESEGFGPRTFSGTGTSTSAEFDLRRGPITATFSAEERGSFTTQLLAVEGESYDDVYLTILLAPVEGSQVASVNVDGSHVLNVETDGAWEITLEQPSDSTAQRLPVEATGSGPGYVDVVAFDGVVRVAGTHRGSSSFIVETVPVDPDEFGELVFAETGQFDGETTVRVDGPSYVNVDADGDWTLSFGT
ncbi:hypothetical protein [Halobaculum limi]|uniref:hypothetical protein n=1 Tax=Halobaculum limi TaxID=3031916 RepID=UPI0024062625|nr:hypothetical protein [Halobaculum sp. YSMS11]